MQNARIWPPRPHCAPAARRCAANSIVPTATAAAFAAAQTATSDTLETLLESARSEADLIRTAGSIDFDRTPCTFPTPRSPHTTRPSPKGLKHWPLNPIPGISAPTSPIPTPLQRCTLRVTANADRPKVLAQHYRRAGHSRAHR
jgi:hypothetical protein